MKTLVIAMVVGAAFGLLPTDAEADGIPIHGNWCGLRHGGGDPVDALDEACKRHDECYEDERYFDCECDEQLIDDIDKLPSGGPPEAALIRKWFTEEQRCFVKVPGPVLGLGPAPVPVPVPPVARPVVDGTLDTEDVGAMIESAIPGVSIARPVVDGTLDTEDVGAMIESAIPSMPVVSEGGKAVMGGVKVGVRVAGKAARKAARAVRKLKFW